MTTIRGVKGMNDVLPEEVSRWLALEDAFRKCMQLASFSEVRTPIVEATPLFVRAIGEATDVVGKEMYSFERHHDKLTLRPEGTAGAVRAYVEHGVQNREPVTRWYYLGAMFRAENVQRGRYRQFHQAGAEIIGDAGPACDAELIALLVDFLHDIRVPGVTVHINTIGGKGTRQRYREALVAALTPKKDLLSDDSKRRLDTNPLRILDSKDPRDQEAVKDAPELSSVLEEDDVKHFSALRSHLDALGVAYEVDTRLVRGLDYYTRTLFEIKGAQDKLGAGSTLVGGGRYDGMLAELGGPDSPAIGFAAGIERLLIASELEAPAKKPVAYLAPIGEKATSASLALARELRKEGLATECDGRMQSVKSKLRRASTMGARFVLVIGDSEIESGQFGVKDFSAEHAEQIKVPRSEIASKLRQIVGAGA